MTASCPVCGQRLPRKARVCDVCGEPIGATPAEPTSTVLAPSAGLQRNTAEGHGSAPDPTLLAVPQPDGRVRHRRVRLLILASVVVLAVALSATYAALRADPQPTSDGAAYGLVRLSSDPGLRWQHPMAQIAPDLNCPKAVPAMRPTADCVVTASAKVQDVVVVSVQRSQSSELIGLSRADGALGWHRRAPVGSTYDCMVTNKRLWCLTVPLTYQVVTDDSSTAGTYSSFSVYARRSAAYRSAALSQIEPSTGAVLRSSPIPGSSAGAAFAGVGFGGFYVIGRGSNSAGTVARFSIKGLPQWSHVVSLVQPRSSYSAVMTREAAPQVYEVGGKALVSLSEVAGRQAVFAVEGGTPIRSAPGHVVAVLAKTAVTQVRRGALKIGDRSIAENAVASLFSDDRSTGEPVMGTRLTAATQDPTRDPPTATFVTHSPTDPIAMTHRLSSGDEPVAYCGGVIVTALSNLYSGYDAKSGVRRWTAVSTGGEVYRQFRCAGGNVVLASDYSLVAYSLKTGAQQWTVSLPIGSTLTESGYGDPQDGLVAGPSDDHFLGGTAGSLSYLR